MCICVYVYMCICVYVYMCVKIPILAFAYKYCGGKGHAALTSSTESGTNECVKSGIFVGVGHNSGVILGTHV